jgi:GNAT superfamily N-acetyltransferase
MSSESITIYEIPNPAPEEDVTNYTEIRLSSLSSNPETFGSTYGAESAFTRDQWVSRVNTSGRKTLIAIDNLKGLWIGTFSVLSPEMLAPIGGPKRTSYPPEISTAEERGELDVFILIGMWVRPDYRRRGVGRMLVQRALEAVRHWHYTTTQPNPDLERFEKPKERIHAILLGVHTENGAARSLYEKNGFRKEAVGEGTITSGSGMVYLMEQSI